MVSHSSTSGMGTISHHLREENMDCGWPGHAKTSEDRGAIARTMGCTQKSSKVAAEFARSESVHQGGCSVLLGLKMKVKLSLAFP